MSADRPRESLSGVRRTPGWGAVAHAFLAVAVVLPLVAAAGAIGIAMAVPAQSMLNRGLLALLGGGFLGAVAWVALLPPVRQVEVAAARVLLGLDLPDVRRPQAWGSRRRGALWLLVLAGTGLVVAVGLLYLLPLGVGLAAHPLSGDDGLRWPGTGEEWHTGAGWSAAWLVLPGVVLLGLGAGLVQGAGTLLGRLAPRVIGPTLAERVTVAAERERDMARANALARELHDSLGHRLTAMTVQATAARRLLASDAGAADRAMAAVEELGRAAQADVDSVVGALRGRGTGTPEDADLITLLRPLVDGTGLDLRVDAPGELRLPGAIAHTAYRVVQEALTNAARHGTGRAELRLEGGAALVIEVGNPVGAAATSESKRSGLKGLRERVLLEGGTLHAGREGDTWLVRAMLPQR